jgi:hypothetical protein
METRAVSRQQLTDVEHHDTDDEEINEERTRAL